MFIDDRSLQTVLQKAGLYAGLIDGRVGPATELAIRKRAASVAPGYQSGWSIDRARLAVEQVVFRDLGFYTSAIDGLNGPASQIAAERWQDHAQFNPAAPVAAYPAPKVWPRQKDLESFYGKPGENQTMLISPYPLFLDWDLGAQIKKFSIHERVHDSALAVMGRVLDHYGPEKIHDLGLDQFGGCLNVRKMRGGSAWSTHAWGIAIDWDADRNPLRTPFSRSQMGKPDYRVFLDLWEAEGWVSLGRARNFDAMHVQAARL